MHWYFSVRRRWVHGSMLCIQCHFISGYSDYRSDVHVNCSFLCDMYLQQELIQGPIWFGHAIRLHETILVWQPSSLGRCSIIWYTDLAKPKSGFPGLVQSPIKLTQEEREFLFEVCDFKVRFSVHCLAFWFLKLLRQKQWKTFVYRKYYSSNF